MPTGKDIENVTVKLVGVIGTLDIPFPLPYPHACIHPKSQLVCPLKAGKMQHFRLQLPVREEYPSVCKILLFRNFSDQTIGLINR